MASFLVGLPGDITSSPEAREGRRRFFERQHTPSARDGTTLQGIGRGAAARWPGHTCATGEAVPLALEMSPVVAASSRACTTSPSRRPPTGRSTAPPPGPASAATAIAGMPRGGPPDLLEGMARRAHPEHGTPRRALPLPVLHPRGGTYAGGHGDPQGPWCRPRDPGRGGRRLASYHLVSPRHPRDRARRPVEGGPSDVPSPMSPRHPSALRIPGSSTALLMKAERRRFVPRNHPARG